jgi:ABC-type transporter Mla MlaB component
MDSVEFAIGTPLTREDLGGLCARVCLLFGRPGLKVAFCDCSRVIEVDAVIVDALARLQLAARRRGCEVRLRHASPELRELVKLMGLDGVLRLEGGGPELAGLPGGDRAQDVDGPPADGRKLAHGAIRQTSREPPQGGQEQPTDPA